MPISMLVTLELVRLFQASHMSNDKKMKTGDIHTVVQASNLNEELGQIQYVFSDKTGTLTANRMVFKKLSVNGSIYGQSGDFPMANEADETQIDANETGQRFYAVSFMDETFSKIMKDPMNEGNERIRYGCIYE